MPASSIDQHPEFKPSSDINEQMLNNLRIRKYCTDHKLIMRTPVISVSGHVDSGKSTTLALVLAEHDVIDRAVIENLQSEAKAKAQAENREYDDQTVNVAKIIEKGKEAQNRGITIETNVHRLRVKCVVRFAPDSEQHKEAIKLLTELGEEHEVQKEDDRIAIHYRLTCDLIDCPGHKKFIHNSAQGVNLSDVQVLLFPSNASTDDEAFSKMVGPESLSMAHAQLGVTSGNQIIFCLSKSELAPSKINERIAFTMEAVRKRIGIKKERMGMIPVSNKKMRAHNLVERSTLDELKEFKDVKFNLMIPDYRDSTVKIEVPATLTNVFDAIRYFPPVISHEGLFNNRGAMLSVSSIARTAHGSVLVCVVINGAIRNGKTVMSTKFGQKMQIVSMEQFKKPAEVSATGAHIGIKVKLEDRKFDAKQLCSGDLLYCDYPENNVPICTSYIKCKTLYPKNKARAMPGQKAQKIVNRKIGNSALLILGSRHTITTVHLYSKNEDKVVTKHSDDAPILEWAPGSIIEALVKFPHPTCVANVNQSQMQSTGGILEHHEQVGTLKVMEHIKEEDGAKLDRILMEQMKKAEKRKAVHGKKK